MKSKLQTANVIYPFHCPVQECDSCNKQKTLNTYIEKLKLED